MSSCLQFYHLSSFYLYSPRTTAPHYTKSLTHLQIIVANPGLLNIPTTTNCSPTPTQSSSMTSMAQSGRRRRAGSVPPALTLTPKSSDTMSMQEAWEYYMEDHGHR